MKIKKIVLILITILVIILGIVVIINKENISNYFKERKILKEKNDFILETQTIMNVASNYFLRVLDPKVNKDEPVEGEVTIEYLIKENYLEEDTAIKGKINVSILHNNTVYIINIYNEDYSFNGNYDNLILENINKLN